ncbi:hypothetical protein F4774DRAFT_143221 [Daldinia eschscholtzii]|nr:hypothetical protein F4774DRAFT_143221 [Daldinia eschscholtzii]
MMKTIVNYCIGSYDRRRTFRNPNDEWKTGLSIRQLFSNYINSIGRKETDLFAKFQELQNGVDTDGRKKKFKEATVEAEQLFGELKDVRDELGIIKSIVGYQKVVQRKLFEKSSTGSSLSTDYIADDIAEMEKLAGRIQSAVDSTLSLLQSEIANFQTEQSVKQGTNMMAFTSITAVFLPLSFLTSLFALDVQSFEKAPVWAFKVIFGVSFPFAALVIYALFCHPYIMVNAKRIRKYPKKQYERIKKQYERIKKEYDEDKGRDDEHKEQDDEYIKKRYSEYIKPYIWHIKKRYTKFH